MTSPQGPYPPGRPGAQPQPPFGGQPPYPTGPGPYPAAPGQPYPPAGARPGYGPPNGQPGGYPPAGPPPMMPDQPVIIDVSGMSNTRATIGAIFGGAAIVVTLARILLDGPAVYLLVLLGVFVLVTGFTVFRLLRGIGANRRRRLVLAPTGLHWEEQRRQSQSIGWSELAAIMVWAGRTTNQGLGAMSIMAQAMPTGNVRLGLYPADPNFAARHPQLSEWWRPSCDGGYVLLLPAVSAETGPMLDMALRRFAGPIYRGLTQGTSFR